MREKVIDVQGLNKSFKQKQVLSDISFSILKGDCLALIGPNGAGKTVLMSCLLGDYGLSQGKVSLLGLSPGSDKLKERVSVLFQESLIEKKFKVREILDFEKAIYPNPLSDRESDDLLGFSEEQKGRLAEKLSGGQQRLLSFVLSLIGRPDILFLDEPTAGMDTSTRKRFWQIVGQLKEEGKTIIYSSHYIEEVEHTADRILVLHQGKLLRDTTPYLMRAEDKEKHFTLPLTYRSLIEGQPVYDVLVRADRITFVTKEPALIWQLLQEKNCPIEDIEMTNRTLLDTLFENEKEVSHEKL